MTGPTHRQYAITFAYIGAILLYENSISNINYYLTIPIMLQIAKYGALFPDVDHHWGNVKDKNTVNKIINTIIHATGGKHRSIHTHSIEIAVGLFLAAIYLLAKLLINGLITDINYEVASLIVVAFFSGWFSHIVADMMTSGGAWLFGRKVRVVPRSIGKLKFNTGNEWEAFVFKCTRVINITLGSISLVYPLIRLGYLQEFIMKFI